MRTLMLNYKCTLPGLIMVLDVVEESVVVLVARVALVTVVVLVNNGTRGSGGKYLWVLLCVTFLALHHTK